MRFSHNELAAMAWALTNIDASEAAAKGVDQDAVKSALEKVAELQSRRSGAAKDTV